MHTTTGITKLHCQIFCWCFVSNVFLSLCNLGLVAIERYIAIFYSLYYYQIITPYRLAVAIVFSWIIGPLIMLIVLKAFEKSEFSETQPCEFVNIVQVDGYNTVMLPVGLLFVLVTVIIYIKIFYTAYKQKQRIQANETFK